MIVNKVTDLIGNTPLVKIQYRNNGKEDKSYRSIDQKE